LLHSQPVPQHVLASDQQAGLEGEGFHRVLAVAVQGDEGNHVGHPEAGHNAAHPGELIVHTMFAEVKNHLHGDHRSGEEEQEHETGSKQAGIDHQPNESIVKTTLIDVVSDRRWIPF